MEIERIHAVASSIVPTGLLQKIKKVEGALTQDAITPDEQKKESKDRRGAFANDNGESKDTKEEKTADGKSADVPHINVMA